MRRVFLRLVGSVKPVVYMTLRHVVKGNAFFAQPQVLVASTRLQTCWVVVPVDKMQCANASWVELVIRHSVLRECGICLHGAKPLSLGGPTCAQQPGHTRTLAQTAPGRKGLQRLAFRACMRIGCWWFTVCSWAAPGRTSTRTDNWGQPRTCGRNWGLPTSAVARPAVLRVRTQRDCSR